MSEEKIKAEREARQRGIDMEVARLASENKALISRLELMAVKVCNYRLQVDRNQKRISQLLNLNDEILGDA